MYVTSLASRLEVTHEVHTVEAEISGSVSVTHIKLGRQVEAGEVLVELDQRITKLQLEEQRARLEMIDEQIEVLEREIVTERSILDAQRSTSTAAMAEARAREREAKAMASFAEEKARRWEELASGGVVSGVDQLEADALAKQRSREVEALHLGSRRLDREHRTLIVERRAVIVRLEREKATLRGEQSTGRTTIERLEMELERHIIRAPVSGRLGDVSPLRIGAVVSPGEQLAAIVPSGEIRAVALYTPAEASGRLRPGQPARIRLDGFPWTQYGSLEAQVTSVASEPQGGVVRVELEIEPSPNSRIPLEHGLPGTAEVEVERATPAILVLRAAGHLISGRTSSASTATQNGSSSPVLEERQ